MGQSNVHLSICTCSKQLYYFHVVDIGFSSENAEVTQNNTILPRIQKHFSEKNVVIGVTEAHM